MRGAMSEILVPADAETLFIKYLTASFAAISGFTTLKAYGRVPKPRPAEFVLVTRVGGTSSLVSDVPTLAVEAWAATAVRAARIAAVTNGLFHAIDRVNGTQFYEPQEFAGPANLPDPESGQERYTQTLSVGVRKSLI